MLVNSQLVVGSGSVVVAASVGSQSAGSTPTATPRITDIKEHEQGEAGRELTGDLAKSLLAQRPSILP
jgi:hypothetical protein